MTLLGSIVAHKLRAGVGIRVKLAAEEDPNRPEFWSGASSAVGNSNFVPGRSPCDSNAVATPVAHVADAHVADAEVADAEVADAGVADVDVDAATVCEHLFGRRALA